jgi:hypothetical protein
MQEHLRELTRAIALGDFTAANLIIGMISRDKPKYSHSIDLGRSDAAVIRARPARPEVVVLEKAA